MTVEQTLTKENFWNEMMEKYPDATKHFCDWIDEYEKEVEWSNLFGYRKYPPHGFGINEIKYHDLPHAMQEGIWFAYLRDDDAHMGWIRDHGNMHGFKLELHIPYYFHYKQEAINKQKI